MDIRHEVNRQKIVNRGETYIPLRLAMQIVGERVGRARERDAREIEAQNMVQNMLEDALLDVMPLVKKLNFDLWLVTMRRVGAVMDPRAFYEIVHGAEQGAEVVRRYEHRRKEDECKYPWVRLLDERANAIITEHVAHLLLEGRIEEAAIAIDNGDTGHDPYDHQPPIR